VPCVTTSGNVKQVGVRVKISRIVTGVLPNGESGIVLNAVVDPVAPAALAGLEFYPLWGTDGGKSLEDDHTSRSYWPEDGGTRFLAVTWLPEGSAEAPEGDEDELLAQAEAAFPGLMGAFEPDNPGFHTSDSIDYGVCLDGEMWLVLDEGHESRITAGTVVVQRGTRHAWQNRSDKAATMLYVLVGGDRATV
jgi:quercetin dioxygenase-like cupin family protein